jgi:hypothetical protein
VRQPDVHWASTAALPHGKPHVCSELARLCVPLHPHTHPHAITAAIVAHTGVAPCCLHRSHDASTPACCPWPTVPLKSPLYDPIQAPEEVPLSLHATSPEKWVQGRLQAAGVLLYSLKACVRQQQEAHQALGLTLERCDRVRPMPVPACWRSWERIQASGELRCMSRTHIHLASQPKHLRGNGWAYVLLQARPAQPAAHMPAVRHARRCCCCMFAVGCRRL